MLQSWSRGADGGGFLFYLLGKLLYEASGANVDVIRAVLALCLWVSAVLWWKMLRRDFSPLTATFAVVIVFLCTPLYVNYLAELRFYSLLILTFTLVVYLTTWMERTKPRAAVIIPLSMLAHALLLTSHLLGLVYSFAILCAIFLSSFPRRQLRAALLGGFGGWLVLLPFIKATHANAGKLNWVGMPDLMALVRFYFHTPTQYRFVNLFLFLIVVVAGVLVLKQRSGPLRKLPFGLTFALVMLAVPTGFYVVSHLYQSIFAERYMMPYTLAFGYLIAWALYTLRSRLPAEPGLLTFGVVFASAIFLFFLHGQTLRSQDLRPYSDIAPLVNFQSRYPLVIPNVRIFLQVKHEGILVKNPIACLRPALTEAEKQKSILTTLIEQGYAPDVYDGASYVAAHPAFLYLDVSPEECYPGAQVLDAPDLKKTDAGTIQVAGVPRHLYLIEHR